MALAAVIFDKWRTMGVFAAQATKWAIISLPLFCRSIPMPYAIHFTFRTTI